MSETDDAKLAQVIKDLEAVGETIGKESLLPFALGVDEDDELLAFAANA